MTALVIVLQLAVIVALAVWVRRLRARLVVAKCAVEMWRGRAYALDASTPEDVRLGALLRQARAERDEAIAEHDALRASLHDRYQARREERERVG